MADSFNLPGYGVPSNQQYPPNIMNSLQSPVAQIGIEGAKSIFANMEMQSHGARWFGILRPYFNVSNVYVREKLKLLLFPFFNKHWIKKDGSHDDDSRDINSPDLYIPSMAFVTYVLLVGFFMGTKYKFTPDVLGTTASTGLMIVFLEVLIVKMILWLFSLEKNNPISIFDLISFSSYKFVGAVVNIVAGLTIGSLGFYVIFAWTSLAMAFFLNRTFRVLVPRNVNMKENVRTYFLLCVAILQIVLPFFLCYLEFQAVSHGSSYTIFSSNTPATSPPLSPPPPTVAEEKPVNLPVSQ